MTRDGTPGPEFDGSRRGAWPQAERLRAASPTSKTQPHITVVGISASAGGIEALQIVLLDLMMPGMDGYEVARRIRREGWDITLVALSGWAQDEHRRGAEEAGFDRHLTKPADIAALEALLDQSRTVQ